MSGGDGRSEGTGNAGLEPAASGFLLVLPWGLEHPGGVNQVVVNLLHELVGHGTFKPVVLVSSWEHPRHQERVVDSRITVYLRLRPAFEPDHYWWALFRFVLDLPRMAHELLSIMRRHGVRVINVHYPTPSTLIFGLLKRARLFSGSVVLSIHGVDLRNAARTGGLARALWKLTFRLADWIVGPSASLCRDAIAFDQTLRARIVTIHNGVDARRLKTASGRRYPLPEALHRHPYILNVATFEPKKGQDVLIQAFARLVPEMPSLRLVIVGRSGEFKATLIELVDRLGLGDAIILVEDVPHQHIAEFLAGATVFCLPSRLEPFGIAILEAGVFELPVVASRVDGVVEVVEHGVTGRLVPPEDPAALAMELRSLLRDSSERKRLGAALRHKVETTFTWARAYAQYDVLVRHV